jgi:hypothetical protein
MHFPIWQLVCICHLVGDTAQPRTNQTTATDTLLCIPTALPGPQAARGGWPVTG